MNRARRDRGISRDVGGARERLPAALLPFDTVRQQVENDFLVTLIDAAVDRHVDELRQRHAVRIER